MTATWDPITLEHDLAAVDYPPGPACTFCGRPGHHPPCCDQHHQPACDTCCDTSGFYRHADPRQVR